MPHPGDARDVDRAYVANGRALFDALPEPKRLEIVRGADHNDLVPPDEPRYWTALREFVSALP